MSALIKRDRDGNAINLPQVISSPAVATVSTQPVKRAGLRLFAGLAIAMTADALDLAFPLASLPVDFVTAVLISILFGWRWETLAVLAPEIFPLTSVFPTWVMLVFYLARIRTRKF